jgi:hypothetical protein
VVSKTAYSCEVLFTPAWSAVKGIQVAEVAEALSRFVFQNDSAEE